MPRAPLVLLFAAAMLVPTPAGADGASEAQFFDSLGRRAYDGQKYEKALEAFQLAHEIAPSYRLLYNIALCADLAGRADMAFSLYEEYLRSNDPDAERRKDAEQRAGRLKEKLALIELTSDPPGAAVFVDRKELGQFGVTPTTIAVVEGEHRLLVERAGFATGSVGVAARRGAIVTAATRLEPLFGTIVAGVTPPSAALRFVRDGEVAAVTAEGARYRLPVGQYRVLVTAPGYASGEAQVLVHENAEARLVLVLAPLPHASGRLLVSTGKTPAVVYLDGKRVAVTPATLSEVATGTHALEVRAGNRVSRQTITIARGRGTYVSIDLARSARSP